LPSEKFSEPLFYNTHHLKNSHCHYFMILQVGSYVSEKTAAGGHQGYAALGGLYTQARPMCPHVYGPLHVQESMIPVRYP
jgi:hypothetical protein